MFHIGDTYFIVVNGMVYIGNVVDDCPTHLTLEGVLVCHYRPDLLERILNDPWWLPEKEKLPILRLKSQVTLKHSAINVASALGKKCPRFFSLRASANSITIRRESGDNNKQ